MSAITIVEQNAERIRENLEKEGFKEGQDWIFVPGQDLPLVLYKAYRDKGDGLPHLHVEDVHSGNCTAHPILTVEAIDAFLLLPEMLRKRLTELVLDTRN